MKLTELDAKYLTLGELFNRIGRLLEQQGSDVRTNVTEVRVMDVQTLNGGLFRGAFVTTDDVENDVLGINARCYGDEDKCCR